MATVYAFVRASSTKKAKLRFRVRDGVKVQLFHTSEFEIFAKDWDNKKQEVKSSYSLDKSKRLAFNKLVLERKELIYSIIGTLYSYEGITSEWLDSEVKKELNSIKRSQQNTSKPETLLTWVRYFIEEIAPKRKDKKTGRLLQRTNIIQFQATEKHLIAFARQKNKPDFSFSEINEKFYKEFVAYLQTPVLSIGEQGEELADEGGNPKYEKKAFFANTVGKHVMRLKVLLREAQKAGICPNLPLSEFYVHGDNVENVYLNEEELRQLKEANLSSLPHLERTRDWFLLLAWTGSRFSDLEKITKSDIKDGFVSFRQQKTDHRVTIPLHPVVVEILGKYDFKMPPPISNQKFNDYIKEAAAIAGIDGKEAITKTIGGERVITVYSKYDLISSHTGRRSFCTNMYKRGLPTIMIMSISGHTSEKTFLNYIKVTQEEHARMMAEAWKKMY